MISSDENFYYRDWPWIVAVVDVAGLDTATINVLPRFPSNAVVDCLAVGGDIPAVAVL